MDKDTLKDDIEAFKTAADAEQQQRKESLEQLKFAKLGEQWPEDVAEQRKKEGRPCLTLNDCPAFAKQVINDSRQNRPSIAVHPVGDGADKDTATVLNGLVRNIQNVSRADIVYDTALEFAVYMGFGYMVVRADYTCDDSFDQDILIERVANPFAVYGDPRSTEADSSDWNSAFIVDMMAEAEFKKKWPKASTKGFEAEKDEATALWYEDKSIRVAERWIRDKVDAKLLKLSNDSIMNEVDFLKPENQEWFGSQGIVVVGDRLTKTYRVTQRIITGEEILETNEWRGKYIPIVPVYGDEANVEGKRYFHGLFRHTMDAARMRNYWRTTSTELVALAPKAPYIGAVGSFVTDAAKWQQANNANLPYLEYDVVEGGQPPQRQPFTGVPAGALQEALNAADDMKRIMGLHDASLGARSNETSGRAIMARQREGDVSTFNFQDNLNRGVEHLGRIIVDLIPKVYTVPRMIRCIKEDGSNYTVPVNQPVMPAQPQEGQQQMPGMPQEQFRPAPEEIPGVTKIFDLTTGKYDVTVAAGPSFTSKREESAEQMMEFIRVFPQSAPLIGDLLAKNLDWPGSDEVAARLKAMLPPQANGVNPQIQQMQQQMQQMDGQAREAIGKLSEELKKAQDAAAVKYQDALNKQKELEIKDFEAKTDRLRAVREDENAKREQMARVIESANAASVAQTQQNAAARPPAE